MVHSFHVRLGNPEQNSKRWVFLSFPFTNIIIFRTCFPWSMINLTVPSRFSSTSPSLRKSSSYWSTAPTPFSISQIWRLCRPNSSSNTTCFSYSVEQKWRNEFHATTEIESLVTRFNHLSLSYQKIMTKVGAARIARNITGGSLSCW